MQEKDKNDIIQEAKILESLNHPNIIHFKELIIDNQNEYLHIVMEYADGGDMNQKIKMQKGIYLCKVKGLKYLNYAILYYNGEYWAQYYKSFQPHLEGWVGCDLEVIEVMQCLEEEE